MPITMMAMMMTAMMRIVMCAVNEFRLDMLDDEMTMMLALWTPRLAITKFFNRVKITGNSIQIMPCHGSSSKCRVKTIS